MSRELDERDIAEIGVMLSPERLANLSRLTGATRTSIEMHQETLRLGADLMCVIATIELALRNTVCENLAAFFGSTGWLSHPPAPFQWRRIENGNVSRALESARRAAYSKLDQAGKAALEVTAFPSGRPPGISHMTRAKRRQQQIPTSEGQVIAGLTFYFWKRLYSADYEHSLWKPTLKRTFPNKKMSRAQVAIHLERIYQTRNRLAHHEPVTHERLNNTVSSIEFVASNLNNNNFGRETALSILIEPDLIRVKNGAEKLHEKFSAFCNI